jgi:hypothetical protein
MATYSYNPNSYKLPEMQKLEVNSQVPTQNINNTYAKNILDSFKQNLTVPKAFTDSNNINDVLYPTQELGNQYIQQAIVPEFQQNTFNPFQRRLANNAAGSNVSLLGSAPQYYQQQTRAVTQPFENQLSQVQQTFADSAQQTLNDRIKAYYDSQLNF